MDTIESMRVLLKEYQNNLNSHSILENVTSSNNFVAAVNDIKNNIMVTKDELPQCVPMLTPDDMISKGITDDMTDDEHAWFDKYHNDCMAGDDDRDYRADVTVRDEGDFVDEA